MWIFKQGSRRVFRQCSYRRMVQYWCCHRCLQPKKQLWKIELWNYEEERFSKTTYSFVDSLWEIIVAVVSIPHLIQLPSLVFALIFLERAFHEHFCRAFLLGCPRLKTYTFEKAFEANKEMMKRRGIELSHHDEKF